MLNIQKQISRLYLSSVLGNLSLTGAWVAILAARGYSLIEIGFAETVFHITSLIFEIPSGVFADVFGRKNMLLVSSIMGMIADILMIASCNLYMICASIAFRALQFNFSSGTGDALAYGTDVLMGIIQIRILASLREVRTSGCNGGGQKDMLGSVRKELAACFVTSLAFLRDSKNAVFLMFCNSLVGAVDILLLFFLQAKLPETGMPRWMLGFALFFMEMGGILGAKIILKCKKIRYRFVFAIAALLVFCGVLVEHSGVWIVMTAGGFVAALSDDALQVRTNTILQDMFPSKQRATLISIESFTFSVIMIVLSPLAGVWFSHW